MNNAQTTLGSLTRAEVKQFHRQGYLGPYTVRSPDEMRDIRKRVDEDVLTTEGPKGNSIRDRYQDNRFIYDILTDPAIIEKMASIYGPDLLLWASTFWEKNPGDKGTCWHQDGTFWPLEPLLTISAWISFTEATEENSCIQLIPGSHEDVLPMVDAPESELPSKTDPECFDKSDAISMELEPGQFFLFNERTIHHAPRNTSGERRLGASMRVTIPIVDIDHSSDVLYPGHEVLVVRGEDWQGLNNHGQIPE